MNTHSDMGHVFSMGSDPSLYNEGLFVARGIENWNLEFRRCKRIVVDERESREWKYNGVQRSTTESITMRIESVVGRR
jgi:hypothetical protein